MAADRVVSLLAGLAGWLCCLAWSGSFYPQVLANRARRSVAGLAPGFVLLNLTGFAAYLCYTALLALHAPARAAFAEATHGGNPHVPLNDVCFAAHCFLLSLLTLAQCLVYSNRHPAPGAKLQFHDQHGHARHADAETPSSTIGVPRFGIAGACALVWASIASGLVACLTGRLPWLPFLQFCGIVKLAASFCKYVPQAIHNAQRQCTDGFSWRGIALDVAGAVCSIVQQLLTAFVLRHWAPFSHNIPKTFLALETLLFGTFLLFQHFVLYSGKQPFAHLARRPNRSSSSNRLNGDHSAEV
jgi:cystinosin